MRTHKEIMQDKPKRLWELDALRGIAIIMMVLFHIVFNLEVFFDFHNFHHDSDFWFYEGRIAAILFILLAGMASGLIEKRYGKKAWQKNAERGLKLIGFGLLITLATFILDRSNTIWFGILHFLGLSILISIPLAGYKWINAALGILLLLAYIPIRTIYSENYFGLIFGILPPSFQTYDHYSLIPWLGFILIGIALSHWLYPKGEALLKRSPGSLSKLLSQTGRYSLWIYLLHQPILLALMWLFL